MHRRFVPLLALIVVAAAPTAAGAKGLTGVTVCGADRCVDRSALVLADDGMMSDLMSYGVTVAAPDPAPHVRLRLDLGEGRRTYGHSTVTYYPTLAIVGFQDGTFHRAEPASARRMAELTRGVRVFGTPAPAQRPVRRPPPAAASDGGGIPAGAWVIGAAAAALLALGGLATLRRGGRPATG